MFNIILWLFAVIQIQCCLQVRNEFYKDAQGALLVYDVTNRASFEALSDWIIEMRTHLSKPQDLDSVIFVVCANKVSCQTYTINLMLALFAHNYID